AAFMRGDLLSGGKVGFGLYGDAGDDVITLDASADVDIAGFLPGQSNGSLFAEMRGGAGNDVIAANYRGENDGSLTILALGEGGNDQLFGSVNLDAGSSQQGFNLVRFLGGQADDFLWLVVHKQSALDPTNFGASIEGGDGLDRGVRTANVSASSIELNVPGG